MNNNYVNNLISYALKNNYDHNRFEDLCNELMYKQGFTSINPLGGNYDNGRDAEVRIYKGKAIDDEITFFQYSLEQNWEAKLNTEIKKVLGKGHKIDQFIFVTNAVPTGHKQDKLREQFIADYNIVLEIKSEKWILLHLRQNPELINQYFDIPANTTYESIDVAGIKPEVDSEEYTGIWKDYFKGRYEEAVGVFTSYLRNNPNDKNIIKAKAWSEYELHRYKEALVDINKLLTLDPDDNNALGIKACILAEQGIESRQGTSVALAKQIFSKLTKGSKNWETYYNFGNTLDALGEHKQAVEQFKKAIKYNPSQAEIWKNLGTAYFHLGEHDKELEAMDKALEINPNLIQGLISKGVTLFQVFDKPKESIKLFDKAFKVGFDQCRKWPAIWYWKAESQRKIGKLEDALETVSEGLDYYPDLPYLNNLNFFYLKDLWVQDNKYIDDAINYFTIRHEAIPNEGDTVIELAKLYFQKEDYDRSWELINLITKPYWETNDITHPISDEYSIEYYLEAIEKAQFYFRFRIMSPVLEYIKSLELEGVVHPEDFSTKLFLVSMHVYSNLFDQLESMKKNDANKKEKIKTVLESRDTFIEEFTRLSSQLIKDDIGTDANDIAAALTPIIMLWPILGLTEFSRILGHVTGYLHYDNEFNEEAIKAMNPPKFEERLRSQTLEEINKVHKFFPDK